ncbi:hypothetical protein Cgig2_029862 [Carnegiea gigantea]|uniref:Bifunctional inhibitor/plant lipid transfer protein/seed storage helical domain-containing protein n=1 Tax=Carnegiea gigantea TaxID=171969 RepID=A0A9Q1K3K5_9CARY|nr:hypothetical protein Cgig2_029862 [Carnegiea gigantea]
MLNELIIPTSKIHIKLPFIMNVFEVTGYQDSKVAKSLTNYSIVLISTLKHTHFLCLSLLMAKNAAVLALIAVVVAAVLVAEAEAACDPMQLMPCAEAFLSSSKLPSSDCCANLKEQKPCLCEYKQNPKYQSYVNSPNARRIATACKVTVDC